jgi:hypothetical protein
MYYTINKEEDILFCKWVLCENLGYCFFVHTLVLFVNGDVVLLVIMYYLLVIMYYLLVIMYYLLVIMYYTINKEEDILFL